MKSFRQIILEITQINGNVSTTNTGGGVTAAAPINSNPPQDGDPDFVGPPSSLKNEPSFKINQSTSRVRPISDSTVEGSAAPETAIGLLQRSRLSDAQKESGIQTHQRLIQMLRNNKNK